VTITSAWGVWMRALHYVVQSKMHENVWNTNYAH